MQTLLHLQLPLQRFSNLQASKKQKSKSTKTVSLNTIHTPVTVHWKKIWMLISYSLIWIWFFSKFSPWTWTPLISVSPSAATAQSAVESHWWAVLRRLTDYISVSQTWMDFNNLGGWMVTGDHPLCAFLLSQRSEIAFGGIMLLWFILPRLVLLHINSGNDMK